MDVQQLINELTYAANNQGYDTLAVTINTDDGRVCSITGVRSEFHEDGDGSSTIFIEVVDR